MHAFGLISRCYDTDGSLTGSPTDWERLRYHIECLNRNAPEGTCHKFFFAARHGQGVHNVAADRYERDAWNVSRLFLNSYFGILILPTNSKKLTR